MYKFNEELCKRLTNGDIACKYDNVNLEMLRALLKKCAPKDGSTPNGDDSIYVIDQNGFWYSINSTTKPKIPLYDFIVNDNTPFEWTDELVEEAIRKAIENATKIDANISAKLCIDYFKASKQRKPLFTTEDGKQIFKEDIYFLVDTSWLLNRLMAHGNHGIYEGKRFSTEAAAREYVRLNKPMYSLNDVKKTWVEITGVFNLEVFIEHLQKLK